MTQSVLPLVESAPNPANRRGNLRGSCAQTPDLTAIDLTQFEDLNLVMRAVCHDWEVAQPIRDAICDQFIPAMEADEASSRSVCRKARRTIHLVRLMLCTDERNRRDEGRPPAIRLRRRVSERRRPRHMRSPKEPPELSAEEIATLRRLFGANADKLVALLATAGQEDQPG